MKHGIRLLALWSLLTGLSFLGTLSAQEFPFTWDNATVYFLMTDRFYDGDPANNYAYGRGLNGNGQPYAPQIDPIGSFLGGDLVGLRQKVSEGYFDSLGVNALWITAPYEQVHGWVGGGNQGDFRHYAYHGYYALDWTEVDAAMGTTQELRALIDTAHAHGIRILFDIVMNHVGYNTAHDMEEFGFGDIEPAWRGWQPDFGAGQSWHSIHDWIDYEATDGAPWCNWWGADWVRAGVACHTQPGGGNFTSTLAGLPDIITESTNQVGLPEILKRKWDAAKEQQELQELDAFWQTTGLEPTPRNYIIKWLTDWVREYGVDGFRVDTYKHVEPEAWAVLKTQAVAALHEWKTANPGKKPDDLPFWMVAEDFGHGPGKNNTAIGAGFDAVINFGFQDQAGNLANLENIYSNYASIVNPDPDWNILSYISSHDTKLFDRNNLLNAGTSLLLLPGAIQIFYGDETGRPFGPTGSDPQQGTRSFMNWDNIDQALLAHWQKLGRFRAKHPSVGAGTHQKLGDAPYLFRRTYQSGLVQDQVLIAIGAQGATVLNLGALFPDGTELRDYYTGQVSTVTNGSATFQAHSNGVLLIEEVNPVIRPILTVTPPDGYDPDSIRVALSAADPSDPQVTIYYTFDHQLPDSAYLQWNTYQDTLTVTQTDTLRAIAVNSQGVTSALATHYFTVGALPDFTVYFKKPDNWNTAYIYFWEPTPEGSLPEVAWPGVPMDTVGNCPGLYQYTFQGVLNTNLIFNSNKQPQTGDLLRSRTGWYVDGAWYDSDPGISCDSTVTPPPPPANPPITVRFQQPPGWSDAYIYTWTETAGGPVEDAPWPGRPMIADCPGWYHFDLDSTDGRHIVFNSNAQPQTGNLYRETDGWFLNGQWYDQAPESYCDTSGAVPDTLWIFFKKPADWASAQIHYWDLSPAGVIFNTGWPGLPMEPCCDDWYRFAFPGITSLNIVFNDSTDKQTADLFRTGSGWYDGQWYDQRPGNQAPQVQADPAGPLSFAGSLTVTLTATDDCGPPPVIYYTLDGSTPDLSSAHGSSPLPVELTQTTTLRFFARDAEGLTSGIQSHVFTLDQECQGTQAQLNGVIPEGTYQYADSIGAGGTVNPGDTVRLFAGALIRLRPGFQALAGASFTAAISNCQEAVAPAFAGTPVAPGVPDAAANTLTVFPNPFRESIRIRYRSAADQVIRVEVFNLSGKLLETPVNGFYREGWQQWEWRPGRQATGMFVIRLVSREGIFTRRVVRKE